MRVRTFAIMGVASFLAAGCPDWDAYSKEAVDAYDYAFVYPEGFDRYIRARDRIYRDQLFLSCLDRMSETLEPVVREEAEACEQQPDPEWRRKCHEENVAADYWEWVLVMTEVAAGNSRYAQTDYGALAIATKEAVDREYGEGTYEEAALMAVEETRHISERFLDCR